MSGYKAHGHGSQFYLRIIHHACLLFRKRSPDGATPNWSDRHLIGAFIDLEGTKCWVGLAGWSTADGLPTQVVTVSYRSSAGQGSSPAKDQRSAAELRNNKSAKISPQQVVQEIESLQQIPNLYGHVKNILWSAAKKLTSTASCIQQNTVLYGKSTTSTLQVYTVYTTSSTSGVDNDFPFAIYIESRLYLVSLLLRHGKISAENRWNFRRGTLRLTSTSFETFLLICALETARAESSSTVQPQAIIAFTVSSVGITYRILSCVDHTHARTHTRIHCSPRIRGMDEWVWWFLRTSSVESHSGSQAQTVQTALQY